MKEALSSALMAASSKGMALRSFFWGGHAPEAVVDLTNESDMPNYLIRLIGVMSTKASGKPQMALA